MKTTHSYRGYVFQIEYCASQPAYLVDFPDLPEIVTHGQTLGEAFAHACEALDLHLETLQKLGKPLPKARHRLILQGV